MISVNIVNKIYLHVSKYVLQWIIFYFASTKVKSPCVKSLSTWDIQFMRNTLINTILHLTDTIYRTFLVKMPDIDVNTNFQTCRRKERILYDGCRYSWFSTGYKVARIEIHNMLLVLDMLRNHKARMTVAFVDKLKTNKKRLVI